MSLNHRCDVTHSYVWLDAPMCVNDSLICVNDTLMCVNDSLICVYDSLICVYDSLKCVYDSLTCVYDSLICVYDSLTCVYDSLTCVYDSLTCVYDSLICVTWRVHGYHVTQSYVWRDSRIRVTKTHTGWRRPIACLKLRVSFRKRATNYRAQPLIIWLFCGKWPMKIGHPICLGHPVCGTWLVHGFHVTAWYVWCDSLVRVTRLTHACQWLTYMCQRLTHRCVWLTRMCDVTHSYV